MSDTASNPSQAERVCRTCRARKRKCDKSVPRCSSCIKRGTRCEYTYPRENTVAELTPSTGSRETSPHPVTQHDSLPTHSLNYATILFLDPGLLSRGHALEHFDEPGQIPKYVSYYLGTEDDLHSTAEVYFSTVQKWMPFLARKRFYDIYLQPAGRSRPDVAALLLAMKLITTRPPCRPRDARTQLYHSTRRYLQELECHSAMSLVALQARILLAVYEVGQAIYPAAYLSIGNSARYAHALGLGKVSAPGTKRLLTLVEAEEQRRTWWAIVVLDNFVNLGCPGRPLATEEPRLDDLLPTDDASWDVGVVRLDEISTVAAPSNKHMTRFALLCQAARLLRRVLACVARKVSVDDEEWKQLDRTVQSMLDAALEADNRCADHVGFVYSTLVALHAPHMCGASDGGSCTPSDERSRAARAVVKRITDKVTESLFALECRVGRGPVILSPWALFFTYHVCSVLMLEQQPGAAQHPALAPMLKALKSLDSQWHVSGAYLQLLEARQAMSQM